MVILVFTKILVITVLLLVLSAQDQVALLSSEVAGEVAADAGTERLPQSAEESNGCEEILMG